MHIFNDTTYVFAAQGVRRANAGENLFRVLGLMGCYAMDDSALVAYHGGEAATRAKCAQIVDFWDTAAADAHYGLTESITEMAAIAKGMFDARFGG